MDLASKATSNAEKISAETGDYSSVTADAASAFERHGKQLSELGEDAKTLGKKYQEKGDELVASLKSFPK